MRGVGREFAASGGKEADKQVGFTVDVCVFSIWMRQSFPNPVLVPVLGGQNLIVAVAVQASGARWQIHHFHKKKLYFILFITQWKSLYFMFQIMYMRPSV